MTEQRDELAGYDHNGLAKLLLATDVLLRLGEDSTDVLPNALEADLWALRDELERALLKNNGS